MRLRRFLVLPLVLPLIHCTQVSAPPCSGFLYLSDSVGSPYEIEGDGGRCTIVPSGQTLSDSDLSLSFADGGADAGPCALAVNDNACILCAKTSCCAEQLEVSCVVARCASACDVPQ